MTPTKISDAVQILRLKEVKLMPTGKISGAVVGRLVKKPDKVNNFLNIIIEDEER